MQPLIKMHLARRGEHRSEKKMQVKDIDGHLQNLRSSLTAEELKYKDKDKGTAKWTPKAGGAAHRPTQSLGQDMSIAAMPMNKEH